MNKNRLLLSVILSVLVGCADRGAHRVPAPLVKPELRSQPSKLFEPLRTNAIALFPLRVADNAKFSPVLNIEQLNRRLIESFQLETSLELLNLTEGAKVRASIERHQQEQQTIRAQAAAFGKDVDAQAVLYGVVNRYEAPDRIEDHRVGFRVWLLDVKTNQVLWEASYAAGNQPLTDNLFRVGEALREGISYTSANQLMLQGFREVAQDLEKLRQTKSAQLTGTPMKGDAQHAN